MASLLRRHSVRSPMCPAAFGLKADNRPLGQSEIYEFISKYYSGDEAQSLYWYPTLSQQPVEPLLYRHVDPIQRAFRTIPIVSQVQRNFLASGTPVTTSESLLNRSRYGNAGIRSRIPDPGDEQYYHYRAEFEVEPFAEFNALEYCWSEEKYSNLEKYQPPLEMVDYMIGTEPARRDLWQCAPREQTFIDLNWRARVNFASPNFEELAEAGFYYTGESDRVHCFWCSLALDCWDPDDDPWRKHARFSPLCPWLLRCRSRHFVRRVILKSDAPAAVEQQHPDMQLILTSWEEAHGKSELERCYFKMLLLLFGCSHSL